jgi:hypothetical protein
VIRFGHRGGLLLVVVATGCARPSTPDPVEPNPSEAEPTAPPDVGSAAVVPVDPSEALADVEETLLRFDFVLRFDIEAEGAVTSHLVGELRSRGETMSLRARGTFGDDVVELSLECDGERLRGSNGTTKLDLPQPVALEEAMVIGLTRMGLLHNLAVLIGARPPDHGEGGAREWVRAEEIASGALTGPEAPSEAVRREPLQAMSFRVVVAEHHAGDATLWWDPASKLPIERHQVVRFPGGEMRVRESYAAQWLSPDAPS